MRPFILTLGFLTVLLGGWTFIVESYVRFLSFGGQKESASGAVFAAELGLLRGSLWASAAQSAQNEARMRAATQNDQAEAAARQAVSLSPTRSDMWLLLAAAPAAQASAARAAADLQMAYFVGGGKREEFEARLMSAVLSPAFSDKQIQDLVRVDIVAGARNVPRFASIAAEIYKAAPATNRSLFLTMLADQDSNLAQQLGTMK